MNKKIVLINPPGETTREVVPNYGLLFIASSVVRKGYSVTILDGNYDKINEYEIVEKTLNAKPFLIGMYTTSVQLSGALKIAKLIKTKSNIPIVLGGPHITSDSTIMERYPYFDYGIKEEGEKRFVELLDNVYKKKNPEKITIGNVEDNEMDYQIPYYQGVDMNKSRLPIFKKKSSYVFIGRGCPYNCIFCSVGKTRYHKRCTESIFNELNFLIKNYNMKHFFFQTGTGTADRKQIKDICNTLIKNKLKISWGVSTRPHLIDDDLVRLMKQAGCVNINFGAESGSEKIRKSIGKGFSNKTLIMSDKICKKNNIITSYFWIYGFPGETKKHWNETLKLSLKLGNFAAYDRCKLYPGTEVYKLALKQNKITKDSWYNYARGKEEMPIYIPDKIKREEIFAMIRKSFFLYYIRPKGLYQLLKYMNLNNLHVYFSDLVKHIKIK